MNTAKLLYDLQEIDLELERKNEALTRVKGQIGRDEILVQTRATLDVMRKELTGLEHQQRSIEAEIGELASKIAQLEKKLYGGSVTSPKELVSLQQDVDMLKGQRKAQDDKLLGLMLQVEASQQELKQKSAELAKLEQQWRQEQKQLQQEQSALEAEIATVQSQRDSAFQLVDPASARLYEDLRRMKQGRAAAKVVQGRCQGCRVSLSIADLQRARSSQGLAKCSNCGRILYLS
ncbi:MAG: hypothetical protein HY665_08420 [Chloroflexi bacterium]|nr:hypothetical protein [Chloroflexota bacterium]